MPPKANPFLSLSPLEGEQKLRRDFPDCQIVGIDEAGRGPLAGPVVAAAVVLPSADCIAELHDSKALSEKKREALFPRIQELAVCWAIAEASPAEIDAINILQADFLAMRRCLAAIGYLHLQVESPTQEAIVIMAGGVVQHDPHRFLCAVDGNLAVSGLPRSAQMPVVKGDAHVASIAAASILAKVHRDRRMVELEGLYPGYGFAKHKGYPSPTHLQALRALGPSPVHRKSFRGVLPDPILDLG